MTVRDISVPLSTATPPWPGDTPFSCGWTWSMAGGASVNVSAITTSPHVGTHADAPLHVRDGWPSAAELPLDSFVGPAVVYTAARDAREIGRAAVAGLIALRAERVLLRTGRSIADGAFPDRWPALSVEAAGALLDAGLRLLGVDCPSVDLRESTTLDTHRRLFEGGACILENLDLRGVADGPCHLIAFPLKVPGLDAAPVRAVLLEHSA